MKYAVFAFLLCLMAYGADETYGNAAVDSVVRVYDGDTFFANIRGYPDVIGEEMGIRLDGIDTPELGENYYLKKAKNKADSAKAREITAIAYKAKEYVEERLSSGKYVMLVDVKRGKYFRLVAKVIVDGKDLSKELIDLGYAKPYDGGAKDSWF